MGLGTRRLGDREESWGRHQGAASSPRTTPTPTPTQQSPSPRHPTPAQLPGPGFPGGGRRSWQPGSWSPFHAPQGSRLGKGRARSITRTQQALCGHKARHRGRSQSPGNPDTPQGQCGAGAWDGRGGLAFFLPNISLIYVKNHHFPQSRPTPCSPTSPVGATAPSPGAAAWLRAGRRAGDPLPPPPLRWAPAGPHTSQSQEDFVHGRSHSIWGPGLGCSPPGRARPKSEQLLGPAEGGRVSGEKPGARS